MNGILTSSYLQLRTKSATMNNILNGYAAYTYMFTWAHGHLQPLHNAVGRYPWLPRIGDRVAGGDVEIPARWRSAEGGLCSRWLGDVWPDPRAKPGFFAQWFYSSCRACPFSLGWSTFINTGNPWLNAHIFHNQGVNDGTSMGVILHLSWCYGLADVLCRWCYPLVNIQKLWKITMFNGKHHFKLPFSIAMFVYQRVTCWTVVICGGKKFSNGMTPWRPVSMSYI